MSSKLQVGACLFGGALVSAGVANAQVVNGSFETGNFSGWTVTNTQASEFQYTAVRAAGSPAYIGTYFGNTFTPGFPATDGNFSATHGFDGSGGVLSIAQTTNISGTILSFDWAAAAYLSFGGSQTRAFNVNIRDANTNIILQTDNLAAFPANGGQFDTGIIFENIDVSAFTGQTQTIEFEWIVPEAFTGPGGAFLDNVTIIPAPASALGLVGASGLMFRRRR